jgi:hypothetical protein
MNILERVRNQAGGRIIILFIAALIFGIAANVVVLAPIVYVLAALVASPATIGIVAYFWTITAEWAKLAVGEKYSAEAYRYTQKLQQEELRATLDSIGVEALDELNAAIQRRDEGREEQA